MELEGAFFDLEWALLHSLPKSGGAMVPLVPRFLRPCPADQGCTEAFKFITRKVAAKALKVKT